VTGRRGTRRNKLRHDIKEKRVYRKLEEEALDRTMWGTGIKRGHGHVVRQNTE